MNRTAFFIDGFNLYHSVRDAEKDFLPDVKGTRWLNIKAFCSSYLAAIGNNAQISEIFYFSALAKHLEASKPDVTKRHLSYIECLKATGVTVELGRFKKKAVKCYLCNKLLTKYEEKESDVAISAKLMEVCLLNQCDTAVLVTGDTDIAPAIRSIKRLCSKTVICVLFPYKRYNRELEDLAHKHFQIKKERYIQHQFPDPFVVVPGKEIYKPSKW
jgi:uncharacterized LabA/DUF88 family protein